MTTSRIDWPSALVPGVRVVPCVLIAGVPVVLTPAGVHPTATAVTSGTVDATWWPGTGTLTQTLPDASTFDPVKEWLRVDEQWEVYETTQPAEGDVKVEPLRFSIVDPGGAATAALSAPNARVTRLLAADCGATGDVTLSDTAGLPSSGVAHIGREAVFYSSITGNVLNVASRGAFGSKARVHIVGNGTQAPLVVIGQQPRYWHGRRAAVFLCVLVGTTLYDPTLIYLGTVGAGIQVMDRLTTWQIALDHSTQAMAQKLQGPSVTLFGYEGSSAFFDLVWDGELTGTTWQRDAVSAVNDLRANAASLSVGCSIQLNSDNTIEVRNTTTHTGNVWSLQYQWDTTNQTQSGYDNDIWRRTNPLPPAFMHASGFVALGSTGDFDKIPDPTPVTVTLGSAYATAAPALVGKTDHVDKVFCTILTRTSGGGTAVDYITTSSPAVWYFDQVRYQLGGTGPAAIEYDTRVSTPSQFFIGARADGGDCLSALQALAAIINRIQGTDLQTESVDWTALSAAFAQRPMGQIPTGRRYLVDGDSDTLIALLVDECRLRGFTLTVRNGLVSAYRLSNLASTEAPRASIASSDLVAGADVEVVDGLEPVASAIEYALPVGGSYTWRDGTSADEFGEGKVIKCAALTHMDPRTWANSAPGVDALGATAQQLLGVLAAPQRIIRVTLPAAFWSLAAGDIVALSHESIPDWSGNRGLTGALCQVMEVRRTFGGPDHTATVQLALRLADDPLLAGWAPSAFVAAGGVDHASKTITVDDATAWGSNGFAPDFDADGNPVTGNLLYGFAVGDAVVLSQMDASSPIADESFTIANISGTSVTLNTFPSTSMATAAASQYGVALRFAPYGSCTARQRKYLFIADHTTGTFSTGAAAEEWAS